MLKNINGLGNLENILKNIHDSGQPLKMDILGC